MEAAQRWSVTLAVLVSMVLIGGVQQSWAQNARSQNFLVHAPTQELAEAVARSAEKFRDDLAMYWLGKPLPAWSTPCPIEVKAGPHLAAQGVTTYNRSPVGNFQMKVIGTPERILDSVLPHEVTHTVLATHFGRPLPRWADEGICTTVEHSAERNKHENKLREFLSNRRGIAMNRLFLLTEYPNDMLPMYAQGYSVCRFLIKQSGPRRFIAFLEGYMKHPSWTANVQTHYGYDSLAQLQENWLAWVAQGSGSIDSFVSARTSALARTKTPELVASNQNRPGTAAAAVQPYPSTGSTEISGSGTAGIVSAGAVLADNAVTADPVPRRTNPSPTAVASATQQAGSGSWYLRRRDQTAQGQIAPVRQPGMAIADQGTGSKAPRKPMGPPSVTGSGRYSVSQPQAEQRFGRMVPMASSQKSSPVYR